MIHRIIGSAMVLAVTDPDAWMGDLASQILEFFGFDGENIFTSIIGTLHFIWDFLTLQTVLPEGNTDSRYGLLFSWFGNTVWGTGPLSAYSVFIDFAVLMAILIFFWGLTKSSIDFSRHESWKHTLGAVVRLVVVIVLINNSYRVASLFVDVFQALINFVVEGISGDPIDNIIAALTAMSGSTESALVDLAGASWIVAMISAVISVTIAINLVKKIIEIGKDCIPPVIFIMIYAFFAPLGLAWLASPEGRHRFTSYISGFGQALLTNTIRILMIVFFAFFAGMDSPMVPGGKMFNVVEAVLLYVNVENGGGIVATMLLVEAQGINFLFAITLLDALLKRADNVAGRLFS